MNENAIRPNEPSDDEILAGVHRHLGGVESLVPAPRGWTAVSDVASSPGRPAVRSRVRFAGLVPLVMIAAILVVVLGSALGSQSGHGTGGGPGTTAVFRLVADAGKQITDADLDTTVQILAERLSSYGAGSVTVVKLPPDEVSVAVTGVGDMDKVFAQIGQTGKLEFVLLPAATYGTATNPGAVALPSHGSRIDPLLPAQFTGADINPQGVAAGTDPHQSGLWLVNFAFKQQAAGEFGTWTGQHINEYFAVVLDGVALEVPWIQSAIVDGVGQINGNYSQKEAEDLAQIIRSGALPFPLALVSMTTNGSAGPESPGPIVAPSIHTPTDIQSSGRTLGSSTAPVTLDIWADYQCPSCKTLAADVLPKLIDSYVKTGKLRIAYHDFLVIDSTSGGHESLDAANATRCAADQGKYWNFHDWLWANQGAEGGGAFTQARLLEIGRAAGLEMTAFQSCVSGGTHNAEVQAESAAAEASGIYATPSVAVNGRQLATYDYETIVAAVDVALAAVTPSPAGSSPAASSSASAPVASPAIPSASS